MLHIFRILKHIIIYFKPLKMYNTNVGKTNIVLYNNKIEELTDKQFNERFFASSASGLYSCVHDLIYSEKILKIY